MPETNLDHTFGQLGEAERLWTPWRMRYVGGGTKESGCIFCNRLASNDDVANFMLHRADHAFVIMNLYPYNTGHVMIVPNAHLASPEAADDATVASMAALLPPTLRALRRALGCDGFNAGFNVGAVAGAGVADHLHQHIVPRWTGDANFMPILASTMVLPELIPVTYAKLRAELGRELAGNGAASPSIRLVILDEAGSRVLLDDDALPTIVADPDQAIWRVAAIELAARQLDAVLAGWAGPQRADVNSAGAVTALTYRLAPSPSDPQAGRFVPVATANERLADPDDRDALSSAIANLASAIR